MIDADPQATISLYFADDSLPLFRPDTATLADFMGVDDPVARHFIDRSPEALNNIWQPTPWPGIKLIPGDGNIQNGDISFFYVSEIQRPGVPSFEGCNCKMELRIWPEDKR